MATNLFIESPDFDRIERGDPVATADAARLLWGVLNQEISDRRRNDTAIRDRWEKAQYRFSLTAGQDNFDIKGATLLVSEGGSSVTVTGIRAGVEGRIVVLVVLGTGTITLAHQSASSEVLNRIVMRSGANLAVATDRISGLMYLNSRWREMNWVLS